MATDSQRRALSDLYEIAIRARDFEVSQLVQRNNFFMIFQGVLLVGLAQASSSASAKPIVGFMLCVAGLLMSIFQTGMAAGAKFWQERWEHAVETAEKELLDAIELTDKQRVETYYLFASGDEFMQEVVRERTKRSPLRWLINARFSPSRMPIYAALSLGAIWLVLLSCTVSGSFSIPGWIAGFR
jgi:hypothetical protein